MTIEVLNVTSAVIFTTLVALGLMVVFGVMGVINMAHGEFVMLGAYTMFAVTSSGGSPWLGIVLAPIVLFAIGILVERAVIRPLHGRRDLSTLLATFGLSIALQQAVTLLFGPQSKTIAAPLSGSVAVFGAAYPTYRLAAMAIAVAVVAALALLFRSTFGIRIRAAMENAEVAASLGTDVPRVYAVTFGIGAALAGLAGSLMAPFVGVVPTMGLEYVVRSFLVVITGGVGSIAGTVGGGVIIGGGRSVLDIFTSGATAEVGVLLLAIIVMLLRPLGLVRR